MNSIFKKSFSKKSLLTSNYNDILHSKFILYIFFAISILNLYYLLVSKAFGYIVFFFMAGFLTSFFSKNMIVIMCIALCGTNLLRFGTNLNLNEPFTSGEEEGEGDIDPEADKKKRDEGVEEEETKEGMEDSGASVPALIDNAKDNNSFTDADIERITKLTTQYEKLLDIQQKMKESFSSFTEPLNEAKNAVKGLQDALQS